MGQDVTSTMHAPVCGTLVLMMCLCKCLIQSSWTDKGPWNTKSQNLKRKQGIKTIHSLCDYRKKKKKNMENENVSHVIPACESIHFLTCIRYGKDFFFGPRPWPLPFAVMCCKTIQNIFMKREIQLFPDFFLIVLWSTDYK